MTIGCQCYQRRPAISTRLELASIDRNMTIRKVCDLKRLFMVRPLWAHWECA